MCGKSLRNLELVGFSTGGVRRVRADTPIMVEEGRLHQGVEATRAKVLRPGVDAAQEAPELLRGCPISIWPESQGG